MTTASKPALTVTHWLIIIVASLGFLFDTYQLLMTPLVGPQAISELLKVPLSNKAVSDWMGNMLWLTALSGGVFGLLGGWLTDRLGRKFVMALGIFVYSLSPVAGAFAQSDGLLARAVLAIAPDAHNAAALASFIFWRCATFVGVCIEFVAAITWIAEVFSDKAQKEKWLGITQLFASLGGVLVTGVSLWLGTHAKDLPHLGMPMALGATDPASWRYLLLTGIIPALLIALMLPFVPESQVWKERKRAGTLKRPSFGALFSPQFRRVTLITAGLSACAYGIAFGALQLTPGRIAPGLPNLADERKALQPLVNDAKDLNADFDRLVKGAVVSIAATESGGQQAGTEVVPPYDERIAKVPGLAKLAGERAGVRLAQRENSKIANAVAPKDADEATKQKIEAAKPAAKEKLAALGKKFAELDAQFASLTADAPDAKAAVIAREKIMKALGDNRAAQEPFNKKVKEVGDHVQLYQEMGGLTGRIVLALLLIVGMGRRLMLRMLQAPGLLILPLTYFMLYNKDAAVFSWGIACAGFVVMSQLSFLGEYLPKVFPLHLRGTGGSFATNVGGRMIGTSAAFLTPKIAQMFTGSPYDQMANAAGCVGLGIAIIAVVLGFFLPEPKAESNE